ncbi:MAG: FHA domain-containing protein [Gemmataceae bacterium]|nr:FHA domain-containing protein [Gemmataceae bacterium]
MSVTINGELVPTGGGDSIPLIRSPLVFGRRSSCDVLLDFPNISGKHCEMFFKDGYWTVKDLNSQNGTKVNGVRILNPQPLKPGDEVAIAKHKYTVQYKTTPDVEKKLANMSTEADEVFGTSLLEKAGLSKGREERRPRGFNLTEE